MVWFLRLPLEVLHIRSGIVATVEMVRCQSKATLRVPAALTTGVVIIVGLRNAKHEIHQKLFWTSMEPSS